MKPPVRLWQRLSKDGRSFKYYLIYTDPEGKRRHKSLGHADKRKANRAKVALETELQQGYVKPDSMRLSQLLEDYLTRTRTQVRQSTLRESIATMKDFISCIGDIDFKFVQHRHGESFLQHRLDKGNSPATVGKKLRHLKRIFQLAVERRQLDYNPLRYVKQPRVSRRPIRIFNPEQSSAMLRAARQYQQSKKYIQWELLFEMALCTGMRRGELLNTTWRDIDFARKVVEVAPKLSTNSVWQWHIKDTDRRKLPLTDRVVEMLVDLQAKMLEGYPYVFVPPERYDTVLSRRKIGKWTMEQGKCPVNNFTRQFKDILAMANLCDFEFHDFRRTCLSRWIENGLTEFEVMTLAGHSKFETTRKFYLAASNSIIDRARATFQEEPKSDSVAILLQRPVKPQIGKGR